MDRTARTTLPLVTFAVLLMSAAMPHALTGASDECLPARWRAAWADPPAADRPFQIVHGFSGSALAAEGIDQVVGGPPRGVAGGVRYYRERGLGGVVCNVAFRDYLRSEENWQTLSRAIEACARLGLIVWIYDEDGYPSGAAGGLVLAANRSHEAAELAYDPSLPDPFIVRPSYEHTHASNNFYAARRAPNLLDAGATRSFIAKTHEAYARRLRPFFGTTIEAFFTDEPSLMAVNIGQLPEHVRRTVRVADPVDAAVRPLPRVPWSSTIAREYRDRYGEDLEPRRASLFTGHAEADRAVRLRFWSLLADLVAERYFGALGAWCAAHGVASSGHTLWEESVVHHVALEGNGLKALAAMHIPGLDMLSSDPEAVVHTGWLTAAMPFSAAQLAGRRRVMTEVSDFIQTMGGGKPVGLPEMQATAAWQAAWGVTDFTLYYSALNRSAETYRAYCDHVGRLNAVLKPARPDLKVALYYPIYDLWSEYVPVAEPLAIESQSERARRIVASFMRLGQILQRRQIPFTLIDHEHLAGLDANLRDRISIATVIVPDGCELPLPARRAADRVIERGGTVWTDGGSTDAAALVAAVKPAYGIAPPCDRIALGAFTREGRRVVLLVNVGAEGYRGTLSVPPSGAWAALDPATGAIERRERDGAGSLPVLLSGRQSTILIESPVEG